MSDWVSVSQAAAVLGKSERTVQRRCKSGALVARLVSADDGQQWQIKATELPTKSASDGATVPTGADTSADRVPPQFKHETEAADTLGATGAAIVPTGAAIGTDTDLLDHLKTENAFLRGVVESQNRDAAELRAALREGLKMSHRALNEGDPQVLAAVSQNDLQGNGGPLDTMAIKETAATKRGRISGTTARDGRGLRGWLLKVLRG